MFNTRDDRGLEFLGGTTLAVIAALAIITLAILIGTTLALLHFHFVVFVGLLGQFLLALQPLGLGLPVTLVAL